MFKRLRTPWYWPRFLFNNIGPGKHHDQCLKIMHDFTEKVSSLLLILGHSCIKDTFFDRKVLIFYLFVHKDIYCSTHQKRHAKMLLMTTHDLYFCEEVRKFFSCIPDKDFRKLHWC